jgi:hypothetical protein
MEGGSTVKPQKCPECGHTLDARRATLVDLKQVVDRLVQVAAEVEACADNEQWWDLQAEFTDLMMRSDALYRMLSEQRLDTLHGGT